jgi:hypothetical protein
MKTNELILLLLILFFLGFGCGYFFSKFNIENKTLLSNSEKEIKRDTIVKMQLQAPLILYKTKLKIIKTSDTVIQSNPFIAKLDTIIQHDTIKADYEFPQNLLSFELKRRPDTLKIQTIEKIKTVPESKPWWQTPAYVGAGVILGYLLGKAK